MVSGATSSSKLSGTFPNPVVCPTVQNQTGSYYSRWFSRDFLTFISHEMDAHLFWYRFFDAAHCWQAEITSFYPAYRAFNHRSGTNELVQCVRLSVLKGKLAFCPKFLMGS